MSTDTLSEVLRAVRLKGAVFFSVHAAEPWVAQAPPAAELAPHVMPGAAHVIEFHVVTAGHCWGGLLDEPALPLSQGDIIVFPHGDAHVMSSAPELRGDVMPPPAPHETTSLPLRMQIGAGGEPDTHVICGFLGCDAGPFNPLLASLPRVIKVRADGQTAALDALTRLALEESRAPAAGSECVLARLSELLFIEVVRRYIAELPHGHTGWLAGLRDDLVGRCLGRLHHHPSRPWTLEDLARELATSRSVLAERFVEFVGVPVMHYLARWRMQLASGLLSAGDKSLAEIALAVGYGSEAAFSRAFKREMGVAPAQFRRRLTPPPLLAR